MAQHFGQEDVNKYKKFKKVDGATYHRVNQFLRKRTYITAREWAISRLCTDFRTRNGAEMTFIGQHLPELVPFMEESYTAQAVNQARDSFKRKVYKSGATFFYGAMCGFFTTEELDDLLFEASEVARFLLEVERSSLDVDEEIDIEDRISEVMRSVGEAAAALMKAREEKRDEWGEGGTEEGPDRQGEIAAEEDLVVRTADPDHAGIPGPDKAGTMDDRQGQDADEAGPNEGTNGQDPEVSPLDDEKRQHVTPRAHGTGQDVR
jgi:hypothetical protein